MVKLTGSVFLSNESHHRGFVVMQEPDDQGNCTVQPLTFCGTIRTHGTEVQLKLEYIRNHFYYLAHRNYLEKTRQLG
jgi:hypothetical protein